MYCRPVQDVFTECEHEQDGIIYDVSSAAFEQGSVQSKCTLQAMVYARCAAHGCGMFNLGHICVKLSNMDWLLSPNGTYADNALELFRPA